MHLSSLNLKGFKSFPERTSLKFGPGVSVIVGPNGSGKSNITDAVLWALGEQSPLAVRGQSMQDVIFAGGHGAKASSAAEVEVVLDNSDGGVELGFGEVSIVRRIDRNGEGEYRLNGARCRLIDVIELLADTGLGKEMHSVVSQGRVEAIITSKPRDRRLLIEEAAGLGKHRRRRRRAQLKLARTQDNLDRVLDIEREARSHLRPLKRQAEAAELHARLARQTDEIRFELVRDDLRAQREELVAAEQQVVGVRKLQGEIELELKRVGGERERAEGEISRRGEAREVLVSRALKAQHLGERVSARLTQSKRVAAVLTERITSDEALIERFSLQSEQPGEGERFGEKIGKLELELQRLEQLRLVELEKGLVDLEQRRLTATGARAESERNLEQAQQSLVEAKKQVEQARQVRQEAERSVDSARREAAKVGSELAGVNQFLRTHLDTPGGHQALADALRAEPGYELALTAALGRLLSAATVESIAAAGGLLDRVGTEGGSAVVVPTAGSAAAVSEAAAPFVGAQPLAGYVSPDAKLAPLVERVLANTWVVDDLAQVSESFSGTAVTKEGRVWFGAWGELAQVPEGGADRILAARNRRESLLAETERAAQAEQQAGIEVERAVAAEEVAATECRTVEDRLRELKNEVALHTEEQLLVANLIERRKQAPDEGPSAVRRAELVAELSAAKEALERFEREQEERKRVAIETSERVHQLKETVPLLNDLQAKLEQLQGAVASRVVVLEQQLSADRQTSEELAARLREYAGEETKLQQRLHATSEQVTLAEVGAQRIRDREVETVTELGELAERLGLAAEPLQQAIEANEREKLAQRLERLARRREQLGPVNPLAKDEYAEALGHVEELETQRKDLEAALTELRSLIRETDRRIRVTFEETFSAAASNFEEMVNHLFPGGKGKLSLVREERREGDSDSEIAKDSTASEDSAEVEDGAEDGRTDADRLGVEIELTPAGKSSKRLSLLSGGEKSLTALAFLFAVFLAKPCPFYILDEVEAALDDVNISRFLTLLEKFSDRAQFIVVTHQKSTMDAADYLYGVSMGSNGISKVISRRMPERASATPDFSELDRDRPIAVRDERETTHVVTTG